MKSLDIVVIQEVDVKQVTFTACVMGFFWGGFLGSISGYILKGILTQGIELIIKGGFLGSIAGLMMGLGAFGLAVSYNLLATMGYGMKVKARAVESN